MQIRISHVALEVTDIESNERFYREVMGLQPAESADDRLICLGHGRGHHILELHAGSGGVHHFGLEVRGAPLDGIKDRLERKGYPVSEQADGLWVADPDGNRIELHGPIDRSGEQTTDGGFRPQRADHITFASPEVLEMVEFYTNGLGLRVSDRMQDDFVWMRGNHHHHDVAVVRAPQAGLDHYSYEICSWENLRIWCDRFAANDVSLTWGPGRHGPGHNLFAFVADPDEHQVELSCDMEQFWDELVDYGQAARTWGRNRSVPNLWGPIPSTRVAVTSTPPEAHVEVTS